jgi:hypothetical protein
MASRPRLQNPEPISPELVLVAPPDVARRAREQLDQPPSLRDPAAAARERWPEPPPRGAPEPQPARPKRRRGRIALAGAAIAALAVVAYVVAARDNPRRVVPAAASTPDTSAPASTRAATATRPTPTTATAPAHTRQPPHAAKTARPAKRTAGAAKPKPTGKRAQATGRPAAPRLGAFVPARTWTWPKSKGARAYETRFLLDGRVVLDMRTTQPRLLLPRAFRFRAGTYRWVVRRIPSGASPRPIVDSQFVLSHGAAARANP